MQIHLTKSVMDPCLLLLGIPQLFIVRESPIGPYGHIRQQAKTQSKIQSSQSTSSMLMLCSDKRIITIILKNKGTLYMQIVGMC
jgi:hypothetical protein